MPANLFYNTSIPTCIIVLKKHREGRDVLFIDASQKYAKGKKQNAMTDDNIDSVMELYNKRETVDKESYLANFKEVRPGDIVYNSMNMTLGAVGYNGMAKSVVVSGYYTTMVANAGYDSYCINTWLKSPCAISLYKTFATGLLKEKQRVQFPTLSIIPTVFPESEEQKKIGQFLKDWITSPLFTSVSTKN